ncbi:glycosyltransferase [Chryseobacterium sp. M5]|uniref:glycosyltransferase n=1 Tax=Chryseobacterium sp. M5 TaxID=3379128 RepID=UPI003857991B
MKNPKILIATPGLNKPMGPFVRNYIEKLPFEKIVLFGGFVPYFYMGTSLRKQKIIRYFFTLLSVMNYKRLQKIIKKRFKKILIKEKIDCVVGDYLVTGAAVREACEELNIPIVANVLGYEINKEDVLKGNTNIYSKLARYNSYVIPVAKNMIPKLKNFGFSDEQIVYSPIGAKEDFFRIKPSYESFQFLAIGRFTETKSPQISIKAFAKVLEKFPQAKFVFAGHGELFGECAQLIKDLQISDKIDLIGWIDQEKQIELLSESSVFIQHSVTAKNGDAEGTPVAIIEASAAGLPVVSTKHGGIVDTIIDGQTGFLVEEHDLNSMAKKMIFLLENQNIMKEFGQKGKEFIRENFSLDKHLNDVSQTIIKSINS